MPIWPTLYNKPAIVKRHDRNSISKSAWLLKSKAAITVNNHNNCFIVVISVSQLLLTDLRVIGLRGLSISIRSFTLNIQIASFALLATRRSLASVKTRSGKAVGSLFSSEPREFLFAWRREYTASNSVETSPDRTTAALASHMSAYRPDNRCPHARTGPPARSP